VPADTANKKPVIVYLNEEDYATLVAYAADMGHGSLSAAGRLLLHVALQGRVPQMALEQQATVRRASPS
jgi:hypothetical protein